MKTFHCDRCGQLVFFENTHCECCGGTLGYDPEQLSINTFESISGNSWRSLHPRRTGRIYRKCENYSKENVCNWMIPIEDHHALCASCRLTRIIPSLSNSRNHLYWQRLETAKRRLLYTLWALKIQPISKFEDPENGLSFEFLEDWNDGQRVVTGHAKGVITLNIAEADPAARESAREQLHEPYRTLLGHFRHESGHYYFDQLIVNSQWEERFRTLFGDERKDYEQSLQQHYEKGPIEEWENRFISAYASSHPLEDWAESWAHYLHMIDTLETAQECGMTVKPQKTGEPELTSSIPPLSNPSFDGIMNDWFALTYVLNNLNRSIGMPDAYPFTLTNPVIEKLRFIHEVVNLR